MAIVLSVCVGFLRGRWAVSGGGQGLSTRTTDDLPVSDAAAVCGSMSINSIMRSVVTVLPRAASGFQRSL